MDVNGEQEREHPRDEDGGRQRARDQRPARGHLAGIGLARSALRTFAALVAGAFDVELLGARRSGLARSRDMRLGCPSASILRPVAGITWEGVVEVMKSSTRARNRSGASPGGK